VGVVHLGEQHPVLDIAFRRDDDDQQAPQVKPVLEVNPEHPLVKKLDGSVHFHDLAHILFDQAMLAEGGLPDDPAAYVKRVNALLG